MGLNVQLATQSRNMVEKMKGVEEEEVEIWDIRPALCQEDENSLD
jgi:hypothetical protein